MEQTENDPRLTILEAAESCFERFGITKTTMEDVARTAELSRATVYRYFADRESLIMESVVRRARLNIGPARAYIAKWPTFEERIVEGITQSVWIGHRDPMVNMLVSPDEMSLATALLSNSGKAVELTFELWEPILRTAQETGAMRADVDLRLLCEWISELEILYIGQLRDDEGALEKFREKVRAFLVPSLLPH